MRRLAAAFALLTLAACSTTSGPPSAATAQYASLDCAALEQERVKLVTELDVIAASEFARIETLRAQIDGVGAVQVEKGCAG